MGGDLESWRANIGRFIDDIHQKIRNGNAKQTGISIKGLNISVFIFIAFLLGGSMQ